jgi:hypothetical protein
MHIDHLLGDVITSSRVEGDRFGLQTEHKLAALLYRRSWGNSGRLGWRRLSNPFPTMDIGMML